MTVSVGILAGGKARRFGSNKAVHKIGVMSMIATQLVEVLSLTTPPARVVVAVHDEFQAKEIHHIIKEDLPDVQDHGPALGLLVRSPGSGAVAPVTFVFDEPGQGMDVDRAAIVGMATVFKALPGETVQLLPCDTPRFSATVMDRLHAVLGRIDAGWDAFIPRWENGFIEPLHGIYRADRFIATLHARIAARMLRIKDIFEGMNVAFFDIERELGAEFPRLDVFENINTMLREPGRD